MNCDMGDSITDPAQRCNAGSWGSPLLCPGVIPLDGTGKVTVDANLTTTLVVSGGGSGATTPPLTLNISGAGFDPNPSGNTVQLSSGTFSITAAHPSRLTLVFQRPPSPGSLAANVTSFAESFGGTVFPFGGTSDSVQVAAVRAPPAAAAPADPAAVPLLASSATQLVLSGSGFDPQTPGSNVVVFDPAVANAVTAATATALTVTFSAPPLPLGNLSVVSVTSFGLASENTTPVQVASVVAAPVVASSAASLVQNAPSLVLSGSGFDPSSPASNSVVLSSGAFVVTAATATSLTLAFSTPPSLGSLTAVVTAHGGTSGAAVQVASVVAAPAVAASADDFPISKPPPGPTDPPLVLSISGSGFDASSPAANVVALSGGAAGAVTSATATTLQVTLSSLPAAAGPLLAVVTSFGGASGPSPGTQVANVVFLAAATPSPSPSPTDTTTPTPTDTATPTPTPTDTATPSPTDTAAPPDTTTPPPPTTTPPATTPSPPPPSGILGDAEAAAAERQRKKQQRAVAAGAAVAGTVAVVASAAALVLLLHPPLRASVSGYAPFSKKRREQKRAERARKRELLAARDSGAGAAAAPSGSALGSSLLGSAAPPSAAAAAAGGAGGSGGLASWGSFGSGSWTSGSGSSSPSGSGIGSGSFGLSPLATPTAAAAGGAGGGGERGAQSRFFEEDSAANGSGSFSEAARPLPAPRRGGGNGNPFSS